MSFVKGLAEGLMKGTRSTVARSLDDVMHADLDEDALDDLDQAGWLANVPYGKEGEEALRGSLERGQLELLAWDPGQDVTTQNPHGLPFWYVAKDPEEGTISLVFPGTARMSDVIAVFADLSIAPRELILRGGKLRKYHGGFLTQLQNCHSLIDYLNSEAFAPYLEWQLDIIGHSLGGALAMVALDGGFVPKAHRGPKHVIMFGAPMAFYIFAPTCSEMNAEVTLVMHEQDIVPRLLGSGNKLALKMVSALRDRFFKFTDEQLVDFLRTSTDYVHPEGFKLVVLRNGRAHEVEGRLKDEHLSLEAIAEDIARSVNSHYMVNYREALRHALKSART